MSSSLQELPAILTTVERRFYPRIVPQAPIYLPLDEKNLALLLNISENGLLVSTQSELPRNFVANVAMPLNGIPKPLQVTVRVVWSNESTMQAGIQLLNLSEHDREQIRRWAQASSFPPQTAHDQPAAVVTASLQQTAAVTTAALEQDQKRSLVAMAATVPGAAPEGQSSATRPLPNQTLAAIHSAEDPKATPTVARTSSDVAPKPAVAKESVSPLVFSWFDQPVTGEISSPGKPEWGKLKWPVVIAALFLSGLYLVESGAISNPFRNSRENSEEAGLPPAPFTPTDQNIQRNLPSSNTPPGYASSEPAPSSQNVAPPSADPVNPNIPTERDLDKPLAHEFVAPLNPSGAPVAQAPGPQAGEMHGPVDSRFPAPPARQNNSGNHTPQNRNSGPSLRAAPRSPQIAKISAGRDNAQPESGDQLAASDNPSASLNPSNSSAGGATSNPASESDNYSADASPQVQSTSAPPPWYSHQPPATAAPRFSAPSSSGPGPSLSNPSLRTAAPYSRSSATPQPAIVPWKPRSPVIQMDVPERRVVTIHDGDSQSFINLPGERVLETPAATMRIQRSVRAPKSNGGWLLHRGKDKKVILGDLASRIDPQVPLSQLGLNDFVRVRATIAEDGSVLAVKPIHGPQYLVPVVLNAVNAWRFQPTYIDGKPVETESDVLIQFHPAKPRSARLSATP